MTTRVVWFLSALLLSTIFLTTVTAWGDFAPMEWRGRKAIIFGTIRDDTGLPLAHAKVTGGGTEWSPDGLDGQLKTFETLTDSLGAYRLEIPAGADGVWVGQPDNARYPGSEPLMVPPIAPGEHRVDMQFQLFRVHGVLLGSDSLPAKEGLVVYYQTPPKGTGMCGTGLPEAHVVNGSFDLTVRHPARISFSASLSNQRFGMPGTYREIQINRDTTVTIQVGGIPIEGTIRGYNGEPLTNAAITVQSENYVQQVRTDASGRFRTSVNEGTYRWGVEGENQAFHGRPKPDSSVITGPTHLELAYDVVRWTGRVIDAKSRHGLDSIWVQAYTEGSNNRAGAITVTRSHGDFSLLVPRGWTFNLVAYDYAIPRVAVPVNVTRDQVDRKYARVKLRTLKGIAATRDSTFEITMEPIKR